MCKSTRSWLTLAIAILATTWITAPAAAIELYKLAPSTKSSALKRNITWPSGHRAPHTNPTVIQRRSAPIDALCGGVWCGRQFIVMVGIGF